MAAKDGHILEVPGADGPRQVRISSPDRVLWPDTAAGAPGGITKLDLARYLLSVGERFMPLNGHRPVTLQRFPTGIEGEEFYSKNPPRGVPSFSRTVTVTYPSGRSHPQLVIDELATAVWAVQMNTITFHPWPVTANDAPDALDNPDELRIDLDPQPGMGFAEAATAALALREVLADAGLTGFAKTSGNRGIHVYARIMPDHEFLDVRHGVIAIARELERRLPDLVTTAWWKEERGTKVFVDFNQANRDRTIASAYSPRPLPGAPVSMPCDWNDLDSVSPRDFTVMTVPDLVASQPDPWAAINDEVGDVSAALAWWDRDASEGMPELSFPPDYPKMPGEPPRVQPSKKRYEDDEYLPSEGGYLRDNPQDPPGGWDSPRRRR
ncbi:MAG: ATP-dependent DNA ligase [Actinomycetota bacterium]|nr:ATP-dependent DNA ligase [Actinomycetota bacterium]